jgi:hypothetical protein
MKLVLEVADIIDELKMIQHLITKQREVITSLILALRKFNRSPGGDDKGGNVNHAPVYIDNVTVAENGTSVISWQQSMGGDSSVEDNKLLARSIAGVSKDYVLEADDKLRAVSTEIEVMMNGVGYTHKMVRLQWKRKLFDADRL